MKEYEKHRIKETAEKIFTDYGFAKGSIEEWQELWQEYLEELK